MERRTHHVSRAQSDAFHRELKAIPVKTWKDTRALAGSARFRELIARHPVKGDALGAAVHVGLLGRAAHATDAAGFHEVLCTGDLPAMELSAAEMEMARGGFDMTLALLAICLAGMLLLP